MPKTPQKRAKFRGRLLRGIGLRRETSQLHQSVAGRAAAITHVQGEIDFHRNLMGHRDTIRERKKHQRMLEEATRTNLSDEAFRQKFGITRSQAVARIKRAKEQRPYHRFRWAIAQSDQQRRAEREASTSSPVNRRRQLDREQHTTLSDHIAKTEQENTRQVNQLLDRMDYAVDRHNASTALLQETIARRTGFPLGTIRRLLAGKASIARLQRYKKATQSKKK